MPGGDAWESPAELGRSDTSAMDGWAGAPDDAARMRCFAVAAHAMPTPTGCQRPVMQTASAGAGAPVTAEAGWLMGSSGRGIVRLNAFVRVAIGTTRRSPMGMSPDGAIGNGRSTTVAAVFVRVDHSPYKKKAAQPSSGGHRAAQRVRKGA
ncbi:Hypothetical Protein RRSL_04181 [Ralstonia solanacearum UW551]|uniref:Uncharacterized protein n=1 Tax=Ralstonia solanacearum (strain UW551) TaxID=342110 RepID=A0AB33VHH1_RALSU|nr:Hypothetical Protein RRSL_04181 [Ralstonia solanacearum UW551]